MFQQTYGDSGFGEYELMIRSFEWGYVTAVIEGEHGVYAMADSLNMNEFEEIATAIRSVLEEIAP